MICAHGRTYEEADITKEDSGFIKYYYKHN